MAQMIKFGIEKLFYFGPLVFAAGFLWPLFSQLLDRAGWSPFGVTPMLAGFLLAAALGIPAQVKGRWL